MPATHLRSGFKSIHLPPAQLRGTYKLVRMVATQFRGCDKYIGDQVFRWRTFLRASINAWPQLAVAGKS